jgi:hypothetical protein
MGQLIHIQHAVQMAPILYRPEHSRSLGYFTTSHKLLINTLDVDGVERRDLGAP